MARNVKSYYDKEGAYFTGYPLQPKYETPDCRTCPVQTQIETLPPDYPRKTTIWGPTNVKHLYSGIPNYYPVQTISRPVGSMYQVDTSSIGPLGQRESYGFMAYPYHHFSPREKREYADYIIPVLDLIQLTKHKTLSEGTWGK